jgi:uncharacterized protein (DUF1501 family)
MHISQLEKIQRREFMRRAGALGIMGSAGPLALSLAAMGEASAATGPSDYKALVCIFLYGGNDHDNTFIPVDTLGAAAYKKYRNLDSTSASDIYIKPDNLIRLVPQNANAYSRAYAVQPVMSPLADLFNNKKKLGVLLNVGTLTKPTTRTKYGNGNLSLGELPPKLFSHNDQFSLWQTSLATGSEGAIRGWGGRMGDIFLRNNSKNSNAHFTCINAASNAVFLAGDDVLPYRVTSTGAVPINSIGTNQSFFYASSQSVEPLNALKTILQPNTAPGHWMEAEWNRVVQSSIDNQATVAGLITGLGTTKDAITNRFSANTDNSLSSQLEIIAKMIAAAKSDSSLGVTRQVFFASLGGFDLHDNLAANHGPLLKKVNDAMFSFYQATEDVGVQNQVTTFTASDFGRTLASNGDGTDHGWGSHHMVMGGAVDGGKFWGTAPDLSTLANALDGPDTVGQGRLLPSTSVDEFAAALARWMGVNDGDLVTVLPNLSSFAGRPPLTLFSV